MSAPMFTVAGAMSLRRDTTIVGDQSFGGRQLRLIAAILLVDRADPIRVDRLVDALWPAGPPARHRPALRGLVSKVRALLTQVGLDRDCIQSRPGTYVVDLPELRVDVEVADVALRHARSLLAAGEVVEAQAHGGEARSILSRPILPGVEAAWADALRRRVHESHIESLLLIGECRTRLGRTAPARTIAREATRTAPFREDAWRLAMRVEAQAGNAGGALRLYERLRGVLAEDLGADPSRETQQLHAHILRALPGFDRASIRTEDAPQADDRLASRVVGAARHGRGHTDRANPYVGLRSFDTDDAALFFGREAGTQELVDRLATHRSVAIIGASGAGKSSLVRAGLMPALARGGLPDSDTWVSMVMTPGGDPFRSLGQALSSLTEGDVLVGFQTIEKLVRDDPSMLQELLAARQGDGTHPTILLIVDQAEELFTLADPGATEAFIESVTDAAAVPACGLRLVVVLRADFYEEAADQPGLARVLSESQFVVTPLRGDGLELAITEPARRAATHMDDGVVGRLVAETGTRGSGLPLLQHVLWELWEQRDDDVMTLTALDRLGGVSGALARHAEEAWSGLDDEAQVITRRLLLRAVHPRVGGTTAAPIPKADLSGLAPTSKVDAVVAAFVDARLLTATGDGADADSSGPPVLEISHETLLTAWPRLASWIDEARDTLRLHRQLATATREWQAAGRDPGYLLTGTRLDLMAELVHDRSVSLADSERDLVVASTAHRDERDRQASRQRARERKLEARARRRLRLAVVVLAVATTAATGLTAWALDRNRQAERARIEAVVANDLTRSGQLTAAAVTSLDSDPELSLLLALHAVNITHGADQPVSADTVAVLHWGIQEVGTAYPVRETPGEVIDGPRGPRGIFPMELPELVALAHTSTSRSLTPDECASWLGNATCPELSARAPTSLTWVDPPTSQGSTGGAVLAGTSVNLLSPGFDRVLLQPETDAFRDATGIEVRVDIEFADEAFNDQLAPGDVDLAILRAPAEVQSRGLDGELIDLSGYLDRRELSQDLTSHLVDLGTGRAGDAAPYEGPIWGVPIHLFVKSLIWYPVPEFEQAGYDTPETWDDLVALVDQLVADGRTPWCHAESLGSGTGWPGTDWIEDIALQDVGGEVYDQWVNHEIPFNDPRIRRAFERYAEVMLGPDQIHGGREAAITAQVNEAQEPMFAEPPNCWLMHIPSFATDFMDGFGARPGEDADVFATPAIAPAGSGMALGSGDYVVAFRDRPEVRETLRWLIGPNFGDQLVAEGDDTSWFFFPNRHFRADSYADPVERAVAERLRDTIEQDTFRYDGSDLMPEPVNVAFWETMVTLLEDGPDDLDALLAEVERVWQAHEATLPED